MPAGKLIFFAGLAIALIGLVIWLAGNKLNWFGHLPGDIRMERENVRFFMPLTSMLLLSLVLSLAAWLIRKFMG